MFRGVECLKYKKCNFYSGETRYWSNNNFYGNQQCFNTDERLWIFYRMEYAGRNNILLEYNLSRLPRNGHLTLFVSMRTI